MIKYRLEIYGLRALAALSVIVYHTKISTNNCKGLFFYD